MKLLLHYTLDNIRRNKRTSCYICIAVLLSSILLSTACIYLYSLYQWRSDLEIRQSGNWHAELGGEIQADQLSLIDSHLEIEKSMIKGEYQIVKLPSDSSLPYLLLRNADQSYWDEMAEQFFILEGHVPQKPGEIVIAKSFFQKNPQYQIGDTITLPVGKRLDGTTKLDVETRRDSETFKKEGAITLTLVGKLDVTTSTVTPGYYAMGYLDRTTLDPKEELVVYVKLKNIRKAYQVMPKLADTLGIPKNEYGSYENHFSYHTALLMLYLVFPPESNFHIQNYFSFLLMGILLFLIACAFIYIIQNIFSLSAQRKTIQLGIFRSIGASPSQIRFVLLSECLLLSIVPIFLGLLIGYLFTKFTLGIYVQILGELISYPIQTRCSFLTILLAFLLCFATVWVSAWIPAHRTSRLSPIESIRGKQSCLHDKKPPKIGWLFRHFGIEGSLASISYSAHRKTFRSSISALFFCLLLSTGFSCLVEISNFNSERNNDAMTYNITSRLQTTSPFNPEMIEEITQIEGIKAIIWYCQTNAAYWASESEQSQEFQENGGFAAVKNPSLYNLHFENNKWRTPVYLLGIADSYFDEYCRTIGISPEPFYQPDQFSAVAYSSAPLYPFSNYLEKAIQCYPLLDFYNGQLLQLEEKTRDSMETDYRFSVRIIPTTVTPALNPFRTGDYSIRLYMPLSCYYKIITNFIPDSAAKSYRLNIDIQTAPENDLQVTKEFRQLLSAWFAEEDIYLISIAEEKRNTDIQTFAMEIVIWCISLLFALIGISTAFLTVTASMQQRRREYAMFRSVGMDFQGIKKLILLEGIRLAVTPICLTIPILFVTLHFLFKINEISWNEFSPYFPTVKLIISIVLELVAVAGAYWISSKQIRRDIIIEAIREDTI